jgi:lipoic acid synthetase
VRAPGGEHYAKVKQTLRELDLHTVCEEAHCPNVGECWGKGTATVLLLGRSCTRACHFCSVAPGNPRGQVDADEPDHVADAVSTLGLHYVVLTMVTRDDLRDGGAAHVARTVTELRRRQPGLLVETLVGDFAGLEADVGVVLKAAPDVFAHNVEVTRRMTPLIRDRRNNYERSLDVLRWAGRSGQARHIKSSLMVGVGETDEEVLATLVDLRAAGADIVTVGQYLRPSPGHAPVVRYVRPEQFARYEHAGRELGFGFVAAGPLVRSSYHAAEAFVRAELRLKSISG